MRPVLAALLVAAAATCVLDGAAAARRVRVLLGPSRCRPLRASSGRRRVAPTVPGPVILDLVAAVLRGGAPVATSLRLVGECLQASGAAGGQDLLVLAQRHELVLEVPAPPGPPWVAVLDEALLLARDTGLAPGPLLASAAADERRRRATRQRLAAARLGVRVVLPTGLCLLPAFVLLTVVPLVLALLGVGG